MKTTLAVLLLCTVCTAQQSTTPDNNAQTQPAPKVTTVPAGTRTLLVLLSPISTKSARPGDGVYLQTAVPITADNHTVIPAGSYIDGAIQKAARPGRVKGRAELQIHFTKVTFPSGYSETLPASLAGAPAEENAKITHEGTLTENGQKGRDAGAIAGTAAGGAVIGGLADGGARGAGIGAGVGAAVALATVLLTRGDELRLNAGDPVEMVLDRPLILQHTESQSTGFETLPRPVRREHNDDDRRQTYPVGYPGPVYPPVIYSPRWPR